MSQTIVINEEQQQITLTITSQGPPGLSVYEIWLAEGNTGSEQDFLDSVFSHGSLTGLLDDDHPQYLTQFRGDLRYPLTTSLGTSAGYRRSPLN